MTSPHLPGHTARPTPGLQAGAGTPDTQVFRTTCESVPEPGGEHTWSDEQQKEHQAPWHDSPA